MQELLRYLRANGYNTYIVTGGGQDFVRFSSEELYGIPPEQVVGSAGATKFGYDRGAKPVLTKKPKLLLNDNGAGKPEGIHLMIRPTTRRCLRQFDRRSANARIYQSRGRRAFIDACSADDAGTRVEVSIVPSPMVSGNTS